MARHCEVTGLPSGSCDCGACDDLDDGPDQGEPWRSIPFRPPAPDDED